MSQDWDQEKPQEPAERRQRRHDEKDEKDEKDERGQGREVGEKYQRDPLGALNGGLVLILLGVGLFAWMQKWITDWTVGLGYFFLGLAAIFLLEALLRLVLPQYRRPVMGRFISAVVMALIGVGFLGAYYLGQDVWSFWPLILIAIGVIVLIGAILGPLFRR